MLKMKCLEIPLADPAHALACDEALLELCKTGNGGNWIWFWEPREYFVVLGYSRPLEGDVLGLACHRRSIPIFRRCSGGGTVLQGPGCLNYSLVLRIEPGAPWDSISRANAWIMELHRAALTRLLGKEAQVEGITDLTVNGRKCCGNAQRRFQHSVLFHGCFLFNLDLQLVEELLVVPRNQPAYRRNRSHREFLMNLELPAQEIRQALCQAWHAEPAEYPIPWERIECLVHEKYAHPAWTDKF
jgi:lipoate-protein ligase A